MSNLGTNDPTILEGVESYCDNYESGFGEVMTLVNVNPTNLEECQLFMHVDHVENSYVIAILLNLNMIPHIIILNSIQVITIIIIDSNFVLIINWNLFRNSGIITK